jgi:hypothetical protein
LQGLKVQGISVSPSFIDLGKGWQPVLQQGIMPGSYCMFLLGAQLSLLSCLAFSSNRSAITYRKTKVQKILDV